VALQQIYVARCILSRHSFAIYWLIFVPLTVLSQKLKVFGTQPLGKLALNSLPDSLIKDAALPDKEW